MELKEKNFDHPSNATKNHIMDTFRIILDEAKRAGLVKENAARQIKLFAHNQKNRDVLTSDEIKKPFPSKFTGHTSKEGASQTLPFRPMEDCHWQ